MGRRPKYSRDGALTRTSASAEPSAEPASQLRGWPPSYYCYACHVRSYSAQTIREGYCEQCLVFLEQLEQTYLSRAAKAVPKA